MIVIPLQINKIKILDKKIKRTLLSLSINSNRNNRKLYNNCLNKDRQLLKE
jgi:hypothetical protein